MTLASPGCYANRLRSPIVPERVSPAERPPPARVATGAGRAVPDETPTRRSITIGALASRARGRVPSAARWCPTYDRTRRIDKNYDKLRRYDAFLCWWIRYTPYTNLPSLPYVLFVCQDESQREQFLAAADRELTGHRWHPTVPVDRHEYVGRRRILFAIERDAHAGDLEAWRLPAFPREHPARDNNVRRVALTSGGAPPRTGSQLRLPGEANIAPANCGQNRPIPLS